MKTETEVIDTIQIRCPLRTLLMMAAEQSLTIYTAVEMGLIKVLDDLDELARADDCPAAIRERLDVLGIGIDE